ncbi:hypothetical protein ACQPZG_04340 (plasmid) [Streptomyces sp. CA-294286]|uniref:hypothetical protein n=1 Tax=Streptomyces sp. CA-294286 TaxID=3240070 RepID=UPI003D8CC552
MTNKAVGKAGQWGCMSVVVIALLGAGIWVGLLGRDMIADTPPALCGSRVLEEGQTCESYSRSTGRTTDTFGAEEAANKQDTAKDFFGWVVVAVGGTLTLAGGGLAVMAVKYRKDD